ncbi:MAG TPA: hypothetical protein VMO26_25415 [Vicinamibacterales bacterium]|nr:hypothetical protein [Vicinamibacterales bacterium]
MSVLPFPVVLFSICQSTADQVDLALRRGDSLRRFLLERVKHIDRVLEPHRIDGIDGPIRIAVMRRDDFENAASAESLQRLDRPVFFTALGGEERIADIGWTALGKAFRSFREDAIQKTGLIRTRRSVIRLGVAAGIE